MDTDGARLGPALGKIVKNPLLLLLPVALVAAAGELATTLSTVVHAWTAPTLLRDGMFTFGEPSTFAEVTSVVAGLLLAVATTAALAVVSLLAAMHELGRVPDVRAALREVRRRWALILGWSALLLGAVLVAAVGIPVLALRVLLPDDAPLIIVPAMIVLVALGGMVARAFPAALVQGVGTFAAWRRIRAHRRHEIAHRIYRSAVGLSLLVVTLGAAAMWAAGRIPGDLGHPTVDALGSLFQVIISSLVLASLAVGLAMAHVNATLFATKIDERDALAWPGLDGHALARPGLDGHALARARTARAGAQWAAVVVAWVIAPLAILAVVSTNPTLAIEPITADYGNPLVNAIPIPFEDGVAIVAHGPVFAVCTAANGCDKRFGYDDLEPLAVAADPDGPGIALLGVAGPEPATAEYVLVTCEVTACRDPSERATQTPLADADLEHLPWLSAVAAADGAYAVVHPSGGIDDFEFVLTRCATASCGNPRTSSLGGAVIQDVVRASFGPDGTLWVLQTTASEDVIRLRSFAPDSTSPVDALRFEMPSYAENGFWYQGELAPLFELVVRDDGTPVVLYRDTTDGALVIAGCEDTACTDTTSRRLPIEPEDAWAAQLAVDATGRPLVATAGDGVRLHSCTDRACTSTRTGLVSLGRPDSIGLSAAIAAPFMVLDVQDRPTFLLDREFARPELLYCAERRCGL